MCGNIVQGGDCRRKVCIDKLNSLVGNKLCAHEMYKSRFDNSLAVPLTDISSLLKAISKLHAFDEIIQILLQINSERLVKLQKKADKENAQTSYK